MVSEVDASGWAPHVSSGKPERGGRPRGPAFTLADRWRAQFDAEDDDAATRTLIEIAKYDLDDAHRPNPLLRCRREEAEETDVDLARATEERVLTLMAGMAPELAARAVSADGRGLSSPAYIVKLRARNNQDDHGRDVEPPEHRVRTAMRLEAEGRPQTKIASELGVSQATVSRLLAAGHAASESARRHRHAV